jgi:large subunit ribosomal protein L6
MSRLGKTAIQIPDKVEISVVDGMVKVKGPKGNLEKPLPPSTSFKIEGKLLTVESDGVHPNARAFHGLARALIQNMVTGVSIGWKKELLLKGIGYRADVQGKKLVLSLGYSHPVEMQIPEGLTVEIIGKKKEELTISGISRELLGEFAANVRSKRPPEPYKGKGVRYKDERVKLKAGKRVGA